MAFIKRATGVVNMQGRRLTPKRRKRVVALPSPFSPSATKCSRQTTESRLIMIKMPVKINPIIRFAKARGRGDGRRRFLAIVILSVESPMIDMASKRLLLSFTPLIPRVGLVRISYKIENPLIPYSSPAS